MLQREAAAPPGRRLNAAFFERPHRPFAGPQVLCKGFPQEFVLYFQYVRALRFEEKPDYAYLRRLFRDLFAKEGTCRPWGHRARGCREPVQLSTGVCNRAACSALRACLKVARKLTCVTPTQAGLGITSSTGRS
jgi:hypothetical protein